jgi:ribosomal protein S18 acetylase RimI-like enzyme
VTIRIRQIYPADLAAVENIFLELRRQTYTWVAPEKFQPTDFAQQTQGENILIAENHTHSVVNLDTDGAKVTACTCNSACTCLISSKVVGFIAIQEEGKFIHHLYVDSRQQRLGIGRALLRSLPDWWNATYQLKCLRLNQRAMTFYHACGFIAAGAGVSEDGEYILLEHHAMSGAESNRAN